MESEYVYIDCLAAVCTAADAALHSPFMYPVLFHLLGHTLIVCFPILPNIPFAFPMFFLAVCQVVGYTDGPLLGITGAIVTRLCYFRQKTSPQMLEQVQIEPCRSEVPCQSLFHPPASRDIRTPGCPAWICATSPRRRSCAGSLSGTCAGPPSRGTAMFSAECPGSGTARTAISLVLTFRSFSVRIAELGSSSRFMTRVEDMGSISFVTVGSFCGNYFCASP